MSNPANTYQASNKTKMAMAYGVTLRVFNNWIEINPELKKIMKPYRESDLNTLPPSVVKRIFEVLGEP